MARLFIFLLLAFVTTAWAGAQRGPGGNSVCAQWCAANFATPGNICTDPAAHGTGPCYLCGPLKTSLSQQLCGGACSDTNTDSKNCGKCGNVCPTGTICLSGVCSPGYKPPLPTSYADCIYDPATGGPFYLLDPQAIPIINSGGKAVEATEVIMDLEGYSLSHPNGAPAGVYDIVLNGGGTTLYLAIFKSGSVGFVGASSNGQTYVDPSSSGNPYVTSIWSVDCNGLTSSGIIGGSTFYFSIDARGAVVASTTPPPSSTTKNRRDIPVPQGFYVYPVIPSIPPLGTRCASGQHAVTKNPPTPLESNGCGPAPIHIPDFDFLDCCNQHDVCFGLCDRPTLDTCNSAFKTCMQGKCDSLYTGFAHWRCSFVAGVYYLGVNNLAAAALFTRTSGRFCDCRCDDARLTACGTSCVDISTDPHNCGSCYFNCPSGACTNGACAFNSCAGETCDTFGPCGPGGSCVCASTAGSTGFCVDGTTPCAGLASCGNNADCPLGEVCAVGTCCGANVCIGTDQCGGFGSRSRRQLVARNWTEATVGKKAQWVD